jgi:hypothetical protein
VLGQIGYWQKASSFAQASVRDLAWMLLSPSLLNPSEFQALKVLNEADAQDILRVCTMLDALPENVWLADTSAAPLGRYAESLITAWLERSERWQVKAAHQQISRDRLTIGEVDYLLKSSDPTIGLEHWESSVSFFLQSETGQFEALGPNLRDTLEEKCTRVFNRQLKLPDCPEFMARFPGKWRSLALFQGWGFLPLGRPLRCRQFNPQAAFGYWLASSAQGLENLRAHGDQSGVQAWTVLDKRRWISPARAQNGLASPQAALEQWFALPKRYADAPLVAGLDANGNEVLRAFVVQA